MNHYEPQYLLINYIVVVVSVVWFNMVSKTQRILWEVYLALLLGDIQNFFCVPEVMSGEIKRERYF